MRIDKYLWCVRLFKTRSLATEACNSGKILMDGHPLKASREVREGMTFTYRNAGISFTYEIKDIPKSRVGASMVSNYIIDKTSQDERDKLEMIRLARAFTRPKGLGRPTKKERRDIESFFDDDGL